jgi:hypothetical protein
MIHSWRVRGERFFQLGPDFTQEFSLSFILAAASADSILAECDYWNAAEEFHPDPKATADVLQLHGQWSVVSCQLSVVGQPLSRQFRVISRRLRTTDH